MGIGIGGTRLASVTVWLMIDFRHCVDVSKRQLMRLFNSRNQVAGIQRNKHHFSALQVFPTKMPRPPHNPLHYSHSTAQFRCSICSKLCKSKAGRIRHIRSVHRGTSFDPEPNDRLPVLPEEDNLPRTPAQLPQALSGVLFDGMGNGHTRH